MKYSRRANNVEQSEGGYALFYALILSTSLIVDNCFPFRQHFRWRENKKMEIFTILKKILTINGMFITNFVKHIDK